MNQIDSLRPPPASGDINPKTLENAKRQFVELYGSSLVLNTYLKITLLLMALIALGLTDLIYRTRTPWSIFRISSQHRSPASSANFAGAGHVSKILAAVTDQDIPTGPSAALVERCSMLLLAYWRRNGTTV